MELRQNRMSHASEILDEINKKKIQFIEIPVVINYTKYSMAHGQSVFNSFAILNDLFINKLFS